MTKICIAVILAAVLSVSTIFLSIGFAQSDIVDINVPETGLRDIQAPVNFPPNYLLLIIVLILLLIIGGLIWMKSKRTKKEEKVAVPVDPRTPWEIAYDRFEALAKSSLLEQGKFKEFYSELSKIVREYFENQFKIRAPEMTTEEFLWSLEESSDLTGSQKNTLKSFLNSCDIVKFAKYIPRREEGQESFQLARKLVEETKIVVSHHGCPS